jgi:hypothetical protein
MQLGVVDGDVVDFGGSAVLFFDKRANLPTRFRPRFDLLWVAAQVSDGGAHIGLLAVLVD